MEPQNNANRILNMDYSELRNFFDQLVVNLHEYERLYVILKSNRFVKQAQQQLKVNFEAQWLDNAKKLGIQRLNSEEVNLLAAKSAAISNYQKIRQVAIKHVDEGFTAPNFITCIFVGAIAYYCFRFGIDSYSVFYKIIFCLVGVLFAYIYVSTIVILCGHNYDPDVANAKQRALEVQKQYDKKKQKYIAATLEEEWAHFLQQPESKQIMNYARDKTIECADRFSQVAQVLNRQINFLPPKYRYNYIVEELYNILKNQEASNWERCTQVYMDKINHQELLSNFNSFQSQVLANQQAGLDNQKKIMEIQNKSIDNLNSKLEKMNGQLDEIKDNQCRQIYQQTVIGTEAIKRMNAIEAAVRDQRTVVNNYYHSPF